MKKTTDVSSLSSRSHSRTDNTLLAPSPTSCYEDEHVIPELFAYPYPIVMHPQLSLTPASDKASMDMEGSFLPEYQGKETVVVVVDEDRQRKRRTCSSPMSRPQRICLWTFVITFIVLTVSFLVLFIVAPKIILGMLENSENMPRYVVSDMHEDRFRVNFLHHFDVYAPFEVTVDRFTLAYGNMGSTFGFMPIDGFVIPPWSAKDVDSTNDFVVTDPQALQQFGHDLLDSMTAGTPRKFLLAAHGDIVLRCLGFLKWTLQYNRKIPFTLGPNERGMTIAKATPSHKLPIVLEKWGILPDLSVLLSIAYNNTGNAAIDLGNVQVDMNVGQDRICTVAVPDVSIAFGVHNIDLKVSLANVGEALLVFLRLLDSRKTVNVTLQNVEIVPVGNQSIPWLSGWFQGISWTVPVTQATLASM